jgi:glutamate-5-semialdehyde dehydrogenase
VPTSLTTPPAIDVRTLAEQSRRASRTVATLSTKVKNAVLRTLADLMASRSSEILAANAADLGAARSAGLPKPKLARLELTPASIAQLAEGVRQVAALPDPVGVVTRQTGPRATPSHLDVRKVRAPLGVVAMIYEARPGVTVDAFALCFKAGNACILRGGKEALRSNAALAGLAQRALREHDCPIEALAHISGGSRDDLATLLTLDACIDLVIPRGGRDLIDLVTRSSRIPTVQHFQGVCHIYVDESADIDKAIEICATAKTSAPATCNAAECILVHRDAAEAFVPRMLERYRQEGVQVRATPVVMALAPETVKEVVDGGNLQRAQAEDFGMEFLDLIVAMRTVDSLDDAIDHIATYGSNHTEAILTRDLGPGGAAEIFTGRVQSSCVLVNASTRFNDGFQLGLGAEIGISTSKIHAYGPMGLEELTTQRWIAVGNGQTR